MLDKLFQINEFWFSKEVQPYWFNITPHIDQLIRDNFLDTYNNFQELNYVANSSLEFLGIIILLDQFPRNMFRNDKKAFSTDAVALKISKQAIQEKFDLNLSVPQRQFMYMPFMHSENIEIQAESMHIFSKLGSEIILDYAKQHRDIIQKFNRFPHRNQTLGRISTPEELEFLQKPHSSF